MLAEYSIELFIIPIIVISGSIIINSFKNATKFDL